MKFYKYKQVARLAFSGNDDELLNDANSVYITPINGGFHYPGKNTKRMRFKLDSNMQNIGLSNNAKLVLESAYIPPELYDYTRTTSLFSAYYINYGAITLRIKNINGGNWNSNQNSQGNTLLLSTFNQNPTTFFNPDPERLDNFSVPNNFLRNGYIEFELVYNLTNQANITVGGNVTNSRSLLNFLCSLVIYDVDEEELLLKDIEKVDFTLKHTNIF